MEKSTIYSIGHGKKNITVFIEELRSFGIDYLLDIRSKPFSKWSPQFNQASLKLELEKSGIIYVFIGDSLGGFPDDSSCYDNKRRVVYDKIKETESFKQGLKRLQTANEKKIRLAIMCSETKPKECHRSKLIGEELKKINIFINHIISIGKAKDQDTVIYECTKGKNINNLFNERDELTSRKSY